MNRKLISAIVITALLLTACSSTTQDRANSNPDAVHEATNVVVYYNADQVPNVAEFCAGTHWYASTLSGEKSASLLRIPEDDRLCAR